MTTLVHDGQKVVADVARAQRTLAPRRGASVPTLLTAVGSALAMIPMCTVFTDWKWLTEAWLALLCVTVAMAVLRIGRRAMFVDNVVGLAVLVGFLVAMHLSQHAWAGFIPTAETLHDLAELQNRANSLITNSRPPVESSPSLRLLSTSALVGLALLIDYIAVVLRARTVTGLLLLALLTASAAIGRSAVNLFAFMAATAGYIVILAVGAARERHDWVDAAPVHGSAHDASSTRSFTALRIGVLALVVAVLMPIITPMAANTGLRGMFARGGGGEGGAALSPFAKLQGSLNQNEATTLFRVTMEPTPVEPYYLRDIVLDTYSAADGWAASSAGRKVGLDGELPLEFDAGQGNGSVLRADVQILGLADSNVPTLATMQSIDGLTSEWRWNTSTGTVSGGVTGEGDTYELLAVQPNLSSEDLRQAPFTAPDSLKRWLTLPNGMPTPVTNTAKEIVTGAATPFDQAIALHTYFNDPANGFTYDTATKTADTGDGLVDFLLNKTGFCQQYAGAMAAMARVVGLPARIVLGYTHASPDEGGRFTVSSHDAHAWVEIYFEGFGWVPFDPTPLSGPDADRAVPLPYAEGNGTEQGPEATTTVDPQTSAEPTESIPLVPDEYFPDSGPLVRPEVVQDRTTLWVSLGLAALVLLALVPAVTRILQRYLRRRRASQSSTIWPLWEEYQATAADLGIGWSAAATLREVPSQVRSALRMRGREAYEGNPEASASTDVAALTALVSAAERERFTASATSTRDTGADIALGSAAARDLREATTLRARVRAWWLPRSTVRPAVRGVVRFVQSIAAAPGALVRALRRTA